ncbi:hypothetical protein BaRGS_00011870 [Batillaria attramentaria]|uniref:Uncharacterized protein n=1 Tax=Batillaria attramentaria TaxID=370345 RepID=A0ABD0LC04_9CAEN
MMLSGTLLNLTRGASHVAGLSPPGGMASSALVTPFPITGEGRWSQLEGQSEKGQKGLCETFSHWCSLMGFGSPSSESAKGG